MSEEPSNKAPADSGWEDQEEVAWREMQELFETMSFSKRLKRTLNGLSMPKDSGEYKFARIQVQRMIGPIVAFLVPVAGIAIMLSLPQKEHVQTRTQSVQIEEATEQPEMEEEQQEIPEPEFIEPMETEFDGPASDSATVDAPMDISNEPVSPQPREMNSVAMVRSPIVMKNILGSRDPGQRGKAMSKYGGAGGEPAVVKALRWLKKNQNPDGSWPGTKPASTGLALLTFLAHGEIPGSAHPEFGPCVQKGLEYLCNSQDPKTGFFAGRDGNNYAHPIALYALSEAYSMTKNPIVKQVAERAAVPVVKGQYASGTWAYNMKGPDVNQNYPNGDSSYAGWCAQSIKAAHVAELNVEGLDECYKKAADGFKGLYNPQTGGFGYNGRGVTGLSSVGALCMQLLGKWDSPEVKKTLELVKDAKYDFKTWDKIQIKGTNGGSPIYYWYYLTQAKFQAGGDTFKSWNRQFLPVLTNMQQVASAETSGYKDENGKPREIGWWDSPSEKEHGAGGAKLNCTHWSDGKEIPGTTTIGKRVQDTCLSALQLMVYYRFLPASQAVNQQPEEVVTDKKPTDIKIGIRRKKKGS